MAQTGMPLQTQKNVKPRLLDQVRQTIREPNDDIMWKRNRYSAQ